MNSSREPITTFEGPAVALPRDNVDTDQIIPARFLKTTSRTGLGQHLFSDWRTDAAGAPRPEFILNSPAAHGAVVLVAGWNFGCGSSREHAPWALADFGFRAIVAASFADIFRQNALKNGLLPIELPADVHAALLAHVDAHPGTVVGVDLQAQIVTFGKHGGLPHDTPHGGLPHDTAHGGLPHDSPFAIDPFARECLLAGVDEIGYVLRQEEAITRFEAGRDTARA